MTIIKSQNEKTYQFIRNCTLLTEQGTGTFDIRNQEHNEAPNSCLHTPINADSEKNTTLKDEEQNDVKLHTYKATL